MICCVSPSEANFHESLNALRYANRARNIKNKPIVNRDPTLVLITELKELVHVLATELVDVRKNVLVITPDTAMSLQELESILLNKSEFRSKLGSMSCTPQWTPMCSPRGSVMRTSRIDQEGESSYSNNRMSIRRDDSEPSFMTSRTSSMIRQDPSRMSVAMGNYTKEHPSVGKRESNKEVSLLKSRALDSDVEVKRLMDKLKEAKQQASNQAERLIMVESERDFFRMKWSDLNPVEAISLQPSLTASGGLFAQVEDKKLDRDILAVVDEQEAATRMATGYLREIRALKEELAEQKQLSAPLIMPSYGASDSMLESELATNVARVIAQTERHLKMEARRLRSIGVDAGVDSAVGNVLSSLDEGNDSDGSGDLNRSSDNPLAATRRPLGNANSQIEVDDLAYQRRQKGMIEEVAELGESIELKEQLLGQLRRSHHQYGVMKAFYEQKLEALNSVMDEKQEERERLIEELSFIEKDTSTKDKLQSEQENRLRLQLQKKDDELRLLKKRQEELCNLSKVQARYMSQVSKLEADVDNMKRQKVDLSKSLQSEKKKHFMSLNEKAREIEKLKKELIVTASEARKLAKDKQRAEEKVKEVRNIISYYSISYHIMLCRLISPHIIPSHFTSYHITLSYLPLPLL